MNLAGGQLAYCKLCWSGFCHTAYQIRLPLLGPCKILTSTLMSSYVPLMCPACPPTFPLTKLSKPGEMPFYNKYDSQPVIPKDAFVEMMKSATSSVEFTFNDTMCKQTDGVAIGSPLGPA